MKATIRRLIGVVENQRYTNKTNFKLLVMYARQGINTIKIGIKR